MSQGLPILIDPLDLARNQAQLKGRYNVAEMPRLAEYSPSDNTEVCIELEFGSESAKLVKTVGSIVTRLDLICERCLKTINLDIELAPIIYFGVDSKMIEQQEERDIIPVDGSVDLMALVEDEILLALPMIPMHESDECDAKLYPAQGNNDTQRAENPFLKLAELKERQRKR